MRKIHLARVAGATAALIWGSLALAAPATEQGRDPELEDVIVTARSLEVSTPLALSRYGNDVEFVPQEAIRNQGFVDTAQALEMLVPGAYVATQAGAFSYINLSLQGSRPGDVLWTVDGVRINNRLYNGTSPADTLPASMIERLEVLKAGQGLLYGTQAVAGVVNVVTRAFLDTPDAAVSVGADSREGLHLNAYGRGAVGPHRFVGWASKDSSDGYWLYDALQPNATTRRRQYDVDSYGLKYGFAFTEDLRLTLQGVHTEAALDYPAVAGTSVNDRNEEVLSARLDFAPASGPQLFLKGYLHDWDTHYYPTTDPTDRPYWGYKDFGLSAAAMLPVAAGLEAHVGYDFQNYRGRDEVLLIEGLTEKAHAVYAQLRSDGLGSEKLRATAGLRFNRTGGEKALVWSTSAVYQFSDRLYVEGSLGTSFLLPDAYQLYAVDPFEPRGNPELEPEKSRNLNLAVGGNFDAGARTLHWQFTGWRRSVRNLITDDDTNPPAGFDSVFINVDETVRVSGGEALLRGDLARDWQFSASWMYSRERNPGTSIQRNDRPLHSGKLGLAYAPEGGPFGVDLALKYAGRTRTTVTGFPVQHYGDAVVANLGAHWYPDGAARRHRVGLRIENLFDTDYATRIRSAVLAGSNPTQRFMYRSLGAPRTAFVNYSYAF